MARALSCPLLLPSHAGWVEWADWARPLSGRQTGHGWIPCGTPPIRVWPGHVAFVLRDSIGWILFPEIDFNLNL
jgi:hypothetical protein